MQSRDNATSRFTHRGSWEFSVGEGLIVLVQENGFENLNLNGVGALAELTGKESGPRAIQERSVTMAQGFTGR